VPLLRLYFE